MEKQAPNTAKSPNGVYAWLDSIIAEQRRIQASLGITPAMLADACEYTEDMEVEDARKR